MPENLRLRLQLIRLFPATSRLLTAVIVGGILLQATLPAGFTIATGLLVGGLPAAVRGGLSSPVGHHLLVLLGLAIALFVAQQVAAPVVNSAAETLGRRLDGRLRLRAMEAASAPAGISHLEDPQLLDQLSLAKGALDGQFTPGGGVIGITGIVGQVLASLASALILARYNLLLAVAIFVTWRGVRSVLLRDFMRQVQVMTQQAQSMRKSTYMRELAITPLAAKELRIFGLVRWVHDRFEDHWREGMTEVWEARSGGWGRVFAITLAVAVTNLAAFAIIGRSAVAGHLTLGEFTIAMMAVVGIGNLTLSQSDLALSYGLVALPALEQLERRAAELADQRTGGRSPAAMPARSIRFEDVRFRYPGRTDDVLAGIDLEIPAGRSLAIVGENGAGKTTLVKLLAGLYQPTGGRITVDGVDLEDFDPRQWQRRVAAIFQDFIHYELPARANVGYGAVEHHDDDAALARVAERAGADTVIADLPNGWDTVLSKRFTDGVELSGGEWQRIALARALFATEAGAGVLVLDEPTANLDVRAEADLYDRFLDLTAGVTTIVISHRFSTVRRADHIVVVEHGRVVEQGDHDSLVAAEGRYAEMFNLQASRFVEEEPA